VTELILLIVFSGIITVDRAAGFNFMISRPLVISVVIGLIFDSLPMCFLSGIIFEMLGLVDVPFGTRVSRDDSFGAYAFCLLLCYHSVTSLSNFILGLALVLIFIYPVTFSVHICRKLNKRLYLREKDKKEFNASRLVLSGLLVHFGQGVVVYNLAFFLVLIIYDGIMVYLPDSDLFEPYMIFTIFFLAGFMLRFLSANSYVKYLLFAAGFAAGWVIL
jgi:PTS system mannose-specific IIC component